MENENRDGLKRNQEFHATMSSRLFIGIAFVIVGLIFTLDRLDVIDAGHWIDWWPVILIAVGISRIVQPRCGRSRGWGIFLTAFGTYFLLWNLDIVDISLRHLWPLFLVLLGGAMIWRAVYDRKYLGPTPPPLPVDGGSTPSGGGFGPSTPSPATGDYPGPGGDPNSTISSMAFLGGVERRSVSKDFRGGDVTAFMGGCNIDLRDAAIANSPAVIDTFAWWGGIEISVPPEWTVVVQGTPILGAYEDKTRLRPGTVNQTLIVRGAAIMGGVEIKN